MSNFENSRPVFIHRSALIDGFEAILAIHQSQYHTSKDDEYSKIYRLGFNDALIAFSKLLGYPLKIADDNELLFEAKSSNDPPHNNKITDSLLNILDKKNRNTVSTNGNGISKNNSNGAGKTGV